MIDVDVKKVIMKELEKGEISLTKARLAEIKEEIVKKTGKHRFVPFNNIKKWIKVVRKEMEMRKEAAAKPAPAEKHIPPAQEAVATAIPASQLPPLMDKIVLQNIGYEVAGIRRAIEKMTSQLEKIEKQLALLKESSK